MFPDSGWVAFRLFFYLVLFLFGYDFLVIAVLVVTLYCDWVWCVLLWKIYFLDCVIFIIIILIIILDALMFIIRFYIRCWLTGVKMGLVSLLS